MTPENFCYWLQGFIEIGNPKKISEDEVRIIRDHLNLVFKKETPDRLNEHFCSPNIFKDHSYDPNPFQIMNDFRVIYPEDQPMVSC